MKPTKARERGRGRTDDRDFSSLTAGTQLASTLQTRRSFTFL